VRSDLTLEQSVFLGTTGASGTNNSVVQIIEWKGLTVSNTVFADYGQRAELYGKLGLSAPYSWINIGNAAVVDSDSPRREAVIRNVFLDEGGFLGLSSTPYRFEPASAPIDLLYVSGLFANVSNLQSYGNYLYGVQRVLIEDSHYGWSHNADAAIILLGVENAILDQVECVDSANRIRADAATQKMTVINSVYTYLDSQSPATRVITTATLDEDPVQYVDQQFNSLLGRDPDAAAHFYWSDRLLQCADSAVCVEAERAALGAYLATTPQEKFAISGRIVGEDGTGMPGVTVALGGAQNVTTETDADGEYRFSNLPTSGNYSVTASRSHYTLNPPSFQIVTPAADQIFNSTATFNHLAITGQVADGTGNPLAAVTVTLSGSQSLTTTTGADGTYSFANLPAGGNYIVEARKTSYSFSPANQAFNDLVANQTQNFTGAFVTYSIGGILVGPNNNPISGATVSLSGSQSRTTTSNSGGEFSFANVPSEGDYTVTLTLIGYSFDPSPLTYNSLAANQYRAYIGNYTTYLLRGHVTLAGGEPLSGATITLSGSQSGAGTTDADGNYSFTVPAEGSYTITPATTNYVFSPASMTFGDLAANQQADFTGTLQQLLEFTTDSYSVSEGARRITVTVKRTGDTSRAAEVVYSAIDGSAQQRSDVIPIIGRLNFEPNETSKTFVILITDDSYLEGDETLTLVLSNPVGGTLGSNSMSTLTLVDNDASDGPDNPIDTPEFFVRQQYRDFLNRPADAEGLDFWSKQITDCRTDAACIADRRVNVSAAFFLSIEFQQTGYLVYRLYKSAYARPPKHIEEFLLDTRTIGAGVVVNSPGWQELLDANKSAFLEEFVRRAEFNEAYPPNLTPSQFVNQLNSTAGGVLSASDIVAAVEEFAGTPSSENPIARFRVLLRVAENQNFSQRELNPAFVLMQYFGYLQRNPSDSPNTNLDGYNFWLTKLNEHNGNFIQADMVKSFLLSGEYRGRFGAP
jgi:hypothetical protein